MPLGPWTEFRRKRPVLIGADLVRFAALLTIPAAFAHSGGRARLAQPLVTRFGRHRVLVVAGTLRAAWPVGLAFLGPDAGVLLLATPLLLPRQT
nr:hypothetical protein GCM10020093_014420 [Planobispora longispora]